MPDSSFDLAAALELLRPGERWSTAANDYALIVAHDGQAIPTLEELQAAWDARPLLVPALTQRQMRRGLVAIGVYAAVEAWLNGLPDGTEKTLALIDWAHAGEIQRTHPMVAAIGAALGKTDAEMDDCFRAWAQI